MSAISLSTARAATTGTVRGDYLAAVNGRGQYVTVVWESEVKTAAKHGVSRRKVTTATVRTGVEYANLAQNADRETGALPWGEWANANDGTSLYPWIIEHKGADYIRVYISVLHYVNGERVSLDAFLKVESDNENGATNALKSKMQGVKSTY